jgi:hypothetical protein
MGFLFLGFLTLAGLLALALGAALLLFRLLFVALWLPFRLVVGLLLFPLWIARGLLKLVGFAILLPLMLVAGAIAAMGFIAVAIATVVVPLLPIVLVGGLVWLLVRSLNRRPATSVVRSY